MLQRKSIIVWALAAVVFALGTYLALTYKHLGKSCGGVMGGESAYQCPTGQTCDRASGSCQYQWPLSLFLSRLPKSTPSQEIDDVLTEVEGEPETQSGPEGKFCGGIANIPCPNGFECVLDGSYPDAGGTCRKNLY